VFLSEEVPCGVAARFINIGNLITLIFPCPFLNCPRFFFDNTCAELPKRGKAREKTGRAAALVHRQRSGSVWKDRTLCRGCHASTEGDPQPPNRKRPLFACE
jgi:hypothetical protein